MAAFFAKTWFLWYALAVVTIGRWFRVAGTREEDEQTPPAPHNTFADTHALFRS